MQLHWCNFSGQSISYKDYNTTDEAPWLIKRLVKLSVSQNYSKDICLCNDLVIHVQWDLLYATQSKVLTIWMTVWIVVTRLSNLRSFLQKRVLWWKGASGGEWCNTPRLEIYERTCILSNSLDCSCYSAKCNGHHIALLVMEASKGQQSEKLWCLPGESLDVTRIAGLARAFHTFKRKTQELVTRSVLSILTKRDGLLEQLFRNFRSWGDQYSGTFQPGTSRWNYVPKILKNSQPKSATSSVIISEKTISALSLKFCINFTNYSRKISFPLRPWSQHCSLFSAQPSLVSEMCKLQQMF